MVFYRWNSLGGKMKNIFKVFYLVLILAVSGSISCGKKYDPQVPLMARFDYYDFESSASLSDRIKLMPKEVLNFYRQIDRRADYQAYNPSSSDKALVLEYLKLLPPIYQKVFKERCAGIYFVENFMGNGMASWIVDRDDKIYFT